MGVKNLNEAESLRNTGWNREIWRRSNGAKGLMSVRGNGGMTVTPSGLAWLHEIDAWLTVTLHEL